ncbi:MAG TPA: tRNA (guanosine(37)-N1)-methyltransferase TrmD, partial [Clostridia bacterium]
MRFDVLTIFPELFNHVMGESVIGRAQKNGIITVNACNIRD